MAVSVNGSEGLGGHAEGFEQQNQGVTRRRPGDGPKVNGGRAQSQEMDSFDQPQYVDEEMGWMGSQDPEGWDRQIATGLTNPGRDVTDESISLKEMFSMEEGNIEDMRAHVNAMRSTDIHGMKDVQARMKKLTKSSSKEKKEHPWMTGKQATQVAKDHDAMGESLKRTFIFKEAMNFYSGVNPTNLTDTGGGGRHISSPFANKTQSQPQQKQKNKPTIEDAHGEYVIVNQFQDKFFNGKNLDEIPDPTWKQTNAQISKEPTNQQGYTSYLVGEDGELTLHSTQYDSGD